MAKLKFEKLVQLFEANEEFSLTETQYKNNVGQDLPKDFYYLKNKSALARTAKEYGFFIEINEKTICLKKAN